MITNAEALRKLLWVVPTDGKPVADCPELHRTTASQVAAYIKGGKVLLVSRERIESIIEELEGRPALPVEFPPPATTSSARPSELFHEDAAKGQSPKSFGVKRSGRPVRKWNQKRRDTYAAGKKEQVDEQNLNTEGTANG